MPLAALTFLITVAYIPGLPSNSTVGRWSLMLIGGAMLLWNARIVLGPGHKIGLWLFAWMLFGFAWCVSGWDHLGGIVQFAAIASVFCAAAEAKDLDDAWLGLGAGVAVSAAFAVAQRFGFEPVWALGGVRSGLFLSQNVAAETSTLAFVATVGLALSGRRVAMFLIPGIVVQMAVVGSREIYLGLAVAGAVAALIRLRPWFAAALVAFAVASSVAFLWISGLMPWIARIADRWEIWTAVATHINPWGDGLGSLSIAWSGYEFAHNEPLHYAFELGVGSVFIWGIIGYAFAARKDLERVVLATFCAQALVWFPIHAPETAMVAAMCAGHLCGRRARARVGELARRAHRLGGVWDARFVGAGAFSEADVGRFDLPFRPKSAMVSGELRDALQPDALGGSKC